jgi:nitroimidazol reductase NimA-like FMN-containing flavoprotein (pyridoxamine 5'-phosphate oxidase superfamily)
MLSARERLNALLARQPFAVLATLDGDTPHQSLVAYGSDDASRVFFATMRATRKYANLSRSRTVSLLVDDRAAAARDLHAAAAADAQGKARPCEGGELELARAAILARHPQLEEFVDSPSTELFRIEIECWYVVDRFQHVERVDVGSGA